MHSLDGIVSENERAAQAEPERAEAERYGRFVRRLRALRVESVDLSVEAHDMAYDQTLTDDAYDLQAVNGLLLSVKASMDCALARLEEDR